MKRLERPDDFEARRAQLRRLSEEDLRARFWTLARQIVAPLVEEARGSTTPSIERSVLLRMGLSSVESKQLVERLAERDLLGHGAGKLVLGLAQAHGIPVREAALRLLAGRHWEEIGA